MPIIIKKKSCVTQTPSRWGEHRHLLHPRRNTLSITKFDFFFEKQSVKLSEVKLENFDLKMLVPIKKVMIRL